MNCRECMNLSTETQFCKLFNKDASLIEDCLFNSEPTTAAEKFLKEFLPIHYLRYLSYVRRCSLPKSGDRVIYIGDNPDLFGKIFTVASSSKEAIKCLFEGTTEITISSYCWWYNIMVIISPELLIQVDPTPEISVQ